MVERVMAAEAGHFPGLAEVLARVEQARAETGALLEDLPAVMVEEVHTCLVCEGREREGRELSLTGTKLWQARYQYASWWVVVVVVVVEVVVVMDGDGLTFLPTSYFSSGVYLKLYPPGQDNTDKDGKPKDLMGHEVRIIDTDTQVNDLQIIYHCNKEDCTMRRKMGYKVGLIHFGLDRLYVKTCVFSGVLHPQLD
jgi:hypothetical protein